MDSILENFGLVGSIWLFASSVVILFLFLTLSLIFNKLLFPVIIRLTNWTPSDLDTRITRSLKAPLTVGIIILGCYLALTIPLDLTSSQQQIVNSIASLIGLGLGIVAVGSAVGNIFKWYEETIAPKTSTNLDQRLVPLIHRVSIALIYALGGLLILAHLNINISPLIAGLGLGGLSVALALQPTLANLFAGTYVMTEGAVTTGDYIQLEGGVEGYVMDVSWRSTRLQTWTNNMVVIPNSKFAETIITNFQKPAPPVNLYLTCGVSYDSDLFMIENICQEVMSQILEKDSNAVKEYGSWFGFESFGESNVNFWVFLQAKDRLASFLLQTTVMQNLHSRFRKDGIVINYPVRSLQLPKELQPPFDIANPEISSRGESRRSRRKAILLNRLNRPR
tara:strand:+ start:1065 stop:2243 length:1179 start_codon:yes stop_codon:yes gene_type:complete